MAWPEPQPGLVISYSYLWHEQHLKGREEGVKNRPCAVVATVTERDGQIMTYVLPITHRHPRIDDEAIEIPPRVKKHLGLDEDQSWIVLSELNRFVWPGPDIRNAGVGRDDGTYGHLPPRLFSQIKEKFFERLKHKKVLPVPRTE